MNRQRQKKALRRELHYMRRRFVAQDRFCDLCEGPLPSPVEVPRLDGAWHLLMAVMCACSGFVWGFLVGGFW